MARFLMLRATIHCVNITQEVRGPWALLTANTHKTGGQQESPVCYEEQTYRAVQQIQPSYEQNYRARPYFRFNNAITRPGAADTMDVGGETAEACQTSTGLDTILPADTQPNACNHRRLTH